jgi:hypothetical protein
MRQGPSRREKDRCPLDPCVCRERSS